MHPLLQEFLVFPGLAPGGSHLVRHGFQGCPQQPEVKLFQRGIRRVGDFCQQVFGIQPVQDIPQIGEAVSLPAPAADQGGEEDEAEADPKQRKPRRAHAESGQDEREEQSRGKTYQKDSFDVVNIIGKSYIHIPCLSPLQNS